MGDDHIPGPSLFLARHEKAHREHLHQHNKFHKRHAAATTEAAVVTEVIETISVVEQIDVNLNGNTISISMVLDDTTANASNAAETGSSSPSTTTAATPLSSYATLGASPTAVDSSSSDVASQSLFSSQSVTTALTFTPSIPPSSASLIVSSNSTTCELYSLGEGRRY
jgi:hypothetical protein